MTTAPCNLCQRGIREEFTAKINGREYVRCKKKMCGFFCPVAQFEEYEDLVDSRVGDFYKGVDAPKCYHNQPTILRISTSEINPGRPYFNCNSQPQCKFFTWGNIKTESPPPQLAEQLHRWENDSSVKLNIRWIRRLKQLREEINNTQYAQRSVMWRERFEDLLEIVLCDECNKKKNDVYQSGDDERAKAWCPTNCSQCRIYTRFFNVNFAFVTKKECVWYAHASTREGRWRNLPQSHQIHTRSLYISNALLNFLSTPHVLWFYGPYRRRACVDS